VSAVPFAHLAAGPLAPFQLVPLLVVAGMYARRARTLADENRPVPSWRQWCFYLGLVTIVASEVSPLGHISQELLSVHMVEHLLMGDIAALLLVLGLTGPLLAPILRIKAFDRLRVLTHPLVAFPLWAVNLYVWHLPVLYEAALRHEGIHALQHICFVFFGANMWMCLFGPLPQPSWFGNLGKLIYIIAVRFTGGVLGNIFVWSGSAFYSYYRPGERYWHVSPTADQAAAGAVMMVEGSILTICLFGWLFLRAARESEERQQLLEYAAAHGLELSEERAARAAHAGRAGELMRRLHDAAEHAPEGEREEVAVQAGDRGR
jgi:cytochrome c oxidase assembly factor CtaG